MTSSLGLDFPVQADASLAGTPELLRPSASMRFPTISEFGAYDNVSDVRTTSCKEAPK